MEKSWGHHFSTAMECVQLRGLSGLVALTGAGGGKAPETAAQQMERRLLVQRRKRGER